MAHYMILKNGLLKKNSFNIVLLHKYISQPTEHPIFALGRQLSNIAPSKYTVKYFMTEDILILLDFSLGFWKVWCFNLVNNNKNALYIYSLTFKGILQQQKFHIQDITIPLAVSRL